MHTQNRKLLCKRDFLIIISLLVVGILSFVLIKSFSADSTTAIISVDEKTVSECNLNSTTEFTLSHAEGAVIQTENGRIRVKSSDCPDKICVKTGYISKEGEKIVCLPKKLIIEVKAEN